MNKCKQCNNIENYNYAIDNGLCNSCIAEKIEQLERRMTMNRSLNGWKTEQLAKLFHETYEKLAPDFGYRTRTASAVPWDDVPGTNKKLMIAVAGHVLNAMKKQGADDCVEDCAVVDSNQYLQKTIALLNSMILSGESHTETSKKAVEIAFKETDHED